MAATGTGLDGFKKPMSAHWLLAAIAVIKCHALLIVCTGRAHLMPGVRLRGAFLLGPHDKRCTGGQALQQEAFLMHAPDLKRADLS